MLRLGFRFVDGLGLEWSVSNGAVPAAALWWGPFQGHSERLRCAELIRWWVFLSAAILN